MPEKRGIGTLSGSYRSRIVELARDRRNRTINVTVLFLDDSTHVFDVDKRSKGSELLDGVFQHLDLQERDYFGLQFIAQPRDGVVSLNLIIYTIMTINYF